MATENTPVAVATVEAFMAALIQAWPTGDATGLGRYFSKAFQNGALPSVQTREVIVASLAEQMTLGGEVGVDIRHLLADGPIVMNERIDYVKLGGRTLSLCGSWASSKSTTGPSPRGAITSTQTSSVRNCPPPPPPNRCRCVAPSRSAGCAANSSVHLCTCAGEFRPRVAPSSLCIRARCGRRTQPGADPPALPETPRTSPTLPPPATRIRRETKVAQGHRGPQRARRTAS
jgi:limonene-1,2-epoxide hydrolase